MPYIGVGPERGKVVEFADAAEYAMERIGIRPMQGRRVCREFLREFEEWFFSGNWLRREEE